MRLAQTPRIVHPVSRDEKEEPLKGPRPWTFKDFATGRGSGLTGTPHNHKKKSPALPQGLFSMGNR